MANHTSRTGLAVRWPGRRRAFRVVLVSAVAVALLVLVRSVEPRVNAASSDRERPTATGTTTHAANAFETATYSEDPPVAIEVPVSRFPTFASYPAPERFA